MVNVLSGKDWIPKWEAKVVMATVTKAQTLNSNKALIPCIAGGKHCDAEMVRQPALARAIKTEMASQEFRVRGEFIEISGFLERHRGHQVKNCKVYKGEQKAQRREGRKRHARWQGRRRPSLVPPFPLPSLASRIYHTCTSPAQRSRTAAPRNVPR